MKYEKWTTDRVKLLEKYWRDDLMSASEIARKLGNTSRNAVIGKIHRMGISGRKSPLKMGISGRKSPSHHLLED